MAAPNTTTPTETTETHQLTGELKADDSEIVFPEVPTGGLRENGSEIVFPKAPAGGLRTNTLKSLKQLRELVTTSKRL